MIERSRMEAALDYLKEQFPDNGVMLLVAQVDSRGGGFSLTTGANLSIESQHLVLTHAIEFLETPDQGITKQ